MTQELKDSLDIERGAALIARLDGGRVALFGRVLGFETKPIGFADGLRSAR